MTARSTGDVTAAAAHGASAWQHSARSNCQVRSVARSHATRLWRDTGADRHQPTAPRNNLPTSFQYQHGCNTPCDMPSNSCNTLLTRPPIPPQPRARLLRLSCPRSAAALRCAPRPPPNAPLQDHHHVAHQSMHSLVSQILRRDAPSTDSRFQLIRAACVFARRPAALAVRLLAKSSRPCDAPRRCA
jgi:hypothetical protein